VEAGRAVLVATHDLLRAERDADSVWLIDGGRLVAEGSPAEIRTAAGAADLDEAFARLTRAELDDDEQNRLLRHVLPERTTP
jgi:ABC-2 type transport system ATP-binding protein